MSIHAEAAATTVRDGKSFRETCEVEEKRQPRRHDLNLLARIAFPEIGQGDEEKANKSRNEREALKLSLTE